MSNNPLRPFLFPLFLFAVGAVAIALIPQEVPPRETAESPTRNRFFSAPAPVQAQASDDFVDAIGVGVGGNFPSLTTSTTRYTGTIKPYITGAGIRTVRWVVPRTTVHSNVNVMKDMGQNGVKSLITTKLLHTLDSNGDSYTFDAATTADVVKAIGVSYVAGVEGPNEYMNSNTDPNWHQHLFDYTQLLRNNLKGDAQTSSVTIVGPTIDPENDMSVDATQDFSSLVDFGNSHTYERPYVSNSNYYQQYFYNYHSARYPGRPMWITETGANTSSSATTGFGKPVTQTGQAQNILRNLFRFYKLGAEKVFIYQFEDYDTDQSDANNGYGLLTHDGVPKPSYDAVKNTIAILKEAGQTGYAAQSLSFGLTGAPSTSKSLLLQKSTGDFYLVLWDEVDGEVTSPVTAQLAFGESISSVASYSPIVSTSPTTLTASAGSYNVSIGASPTIYKITRAVAPASSPSTSTPTPSAGSTATTSSGGSTSSGSSGTSSGTSDKGTSTGTASPNTTTEGSETPGESAASPTTTEEATTTETEAEPTATDGPAAEAALTSDGFVAAQMPQKMLMMVGALVALFMFVLGRIVLLMIRYRRAVL